MENNTKKRQIRLMVVALTILIIGVVGITYAFFNYTRTGNLNNLGTGRISFNSVQGDALNMTNLFPMSSSEASLADLDSVEITITGDTTFDEGEEYEVSLVDVNNAVNGKKVPLNYLATYEANQDSVIGSNNENYFTARENKNANIYTLRDHGAILEGEQVLVGYIKNDNDGIGGTLTIKAYIDEARIAISDTYPPDDENIKYEINPEGTSSCVSFLTDEGATAGLMQGESLESFCNGTGTLNGVSLRYFLNAELLPNNYLSYFLEHNVISIKQYYNLTSDEWVNGRVVFTTEEWNSVSSTPISFKVRVESNEGLWVEERASRNDMIHLSDALSTQQRNSITEVNFVRMNEETINSHNNLIDLSPNGGIGIVKGWMDGTKLYIASPGDTYLPVDSDGMFYNYTNLVSINFNNINSILVENMSGMFNNCTSLTSVDLSSFKSPNLTNITALFANDTNLSNINLLGFDTSSVMYMADVFSGCTSLTTLNLSEFNTDNVRNMGGMFAECTNLVSLNLSHFNTENVVNMYSMFWKCTNLESIVLTSFDTGNVTDMSGMFADCSSLTSLDLSSFELSSVNITSGMFYDCGLLVTILVSNAWDATNVGASAGMFYNCESIKGSQNTGYDANFVDKTYAKIDGGQSNKGYLTLKTN